MSSSPQRRAANESAVRRANERIEKGTLELNGRAATVRPIPFICECDDPRCTTIIWLSLRAYENVRSGPTRFLIAPGHESEADVVVADGDRFAVIEKTGVEGGLVAQDDPRS